MNTIIKINETGLVSTNQIFKTKDKEKFMIKFPRGFWNLFYNKYRDETIERFNDGDESDEMKGYHSNVNNVPVYNVYKNGKKASIALPRYTKEENKPFLLIPKMNKGLVRSPIAKNYYIFDVDDDFNINHMAKLMFGI